MFRLTLRILYYILLVFLALLIANNVTSTKLSHCSKGADSFGMWLNTGDVTGSEDKLAEFGSHFLDSEPGEALQFSQVWRPNNCSYHRFTKESLETVIDHVLSAKHGSKRPKSDQVHLLFMTDSGTRGQLCGIIRMIQGTEVYGPTENIICGYGPDRLAYRDTNQFVNMTFFDNKLVIHYSYTRAFVENDDVLDKVIHESIRKFKPHTFVFNTGFWSYIKLTWDPKWELLEPPGPCSNPAYFNVSESRGSPAINKTLWEVSDYAKQEHIQLIYRNSHYNLLYDPECSDKKVEQNIRGSHWQLYDNRRISKDVYRKQLFDDYFHYDREYSFTQHQHFQEREAKFKHFGVYPGQMEMQFAQSLLNFIFHNALSEMTRHGISMQKH